ncbi:cryptochrome/photolyase family protein [Jeotgalibacillus sp. JSM ZJ347]|uniref:cryptochrome/photolyase family protein n=1 Tax=Jeotgalibacillus sp. JSM ZJ347 TaxID=3342117 RepID=UPI0035A94593
MATRWIFGNQLCHELPIVKEADKEHDVFLMIEAESRSTWQHYHKQKLVLIFSAMRHFAAELEDKGYRVDYREADSFEDAWKAHANEFEPEKVFYTLHMDYRMTQAMKKWEKSLSGIDVEVLDARPLFLLTAEEIKGELKGDGPWKMDPFYRRMRKRLDVLIEDEDPVGGKWSFDQDNRKSAKSDTTFTTARSFRPDDITKEVMEKVEKQFKDNPGEIKPFRWAVTRKEALQALNQFIKERLETFGTYQDAMLQGDDFMSHSLLSSSINIGLLTPMEVVRKAEQAYLDGEVPLNSAEGFIRQIIGWREFIRGVYLKKMPDYGDVNKFNHQRDLPSFFWDAETDMNCMHESIRPVVEHAYNHHIQRLMVIGNYATLFGLSPQQTADWFNEMYIDAHDWVVLPNVLGMALYADGGVLSTKPYVASGKYINKMSNYCGSCKYNVKHQTEEDACPFNALYWHFLDRHADTLSNNHRMGLVYKQWQKRDPDVKRAILEKAERVLKE